MKNKIILAIIVIILTGSSFFAWHQNKNYSNTSKITDIQLSIGGNFQSTKYHVKDSQLIYDYSGAKGEQHSNAVLAPSSLAKLDSIFAKYDLATLQSDSMGGPDMFNYYLVVTKNGKIYGLQFVSPQNPGFTLSSELQKYFNQIKK